MRFVFYCAFFFGLFYFLGRRRRFDFFTVGFFGGCFYFLPGLFGFLFAFDRLDLGGLSEQILPQTYLVMSLVLVSLVVSAFFFDRKYGTAPRPGVPVRLQGSPENWAVLLATVGFGLSLLTTGRHLLDEDKGQMMLFLDRWSILWEVGATVGLTLAFATKNRRVFVVCTLLLLADWYIGFRINLILATLSVVVYAYSARGAIRLIRQSRVLAFSGLFAAFGFLYPALGQLVKAGDWGQMKDLVTRPDYYATQVILSEPFVIQTTLNEVISTNFRVGAGHLWSLLYVVVPFGNELGGKVLTFNDLFQGSLFPGVAFGMAQNIWAQAWSIGGLFVVVVFVLLYIAGVWQGSKILLSRSEFWRTFAALFFTPWAFYLYRNDLLYQFVMERRILVMFMCAALIASILHGPALTTTRLEPSAVPTRCVRQ